MHCYTVVYYVLLCTFKSFIIKRDWLYGFSLGPVNKQPFFESKSFTYLHKNVRIDINRYFQSS